MSLSTDHIWHPFTQMKTADAPIHISTAKDCRLFAADGASYIDAISSWWVNIHGHANPYIAACIARQATTLEHVIFAGFTHTPAIELSQKLTGLLKGYFTKIFFSDDGSTSVEVALKMALQYWYNLGMIEKTRVIAFENAYHGDTFGAMSAGARNTFNAAFNRHLFEVIHIPVPTKNNWDDVVNTFTGLLNAGSIAAFIFEPIVQGAAGMQMHEARYLNNLLSVAKEKDILCIADEVMTGFGRTGKNFAIDHLQHSPDIICLSKGITGGFMPLGVTACSQKIYDAFYGNEKEKTFFHGHSYTANPLACAAANASMTILVSEQCQQQIQMIAERHRAFAASIQEMPVVKEVRYLGTILAVELNTGEDSSYFHSIRDNLYRFYLQNGVLLRPLGNVVYIMPPYCITGEELDIIYEVMLRSFDII